MAKRVQLTICIHIYKYTSLVPKNNNNLYGCLNTRLMFSFMMNHRLSDSES